MADQISMPSGMGGLTRYFDDYKSKIQFKPWQVVALVALFILFVTVIFPAMFP